MLDLVSLLDNNPCMQCPRCNTPYTASQEFCHNCGMVLPTPEVGHNLGQYSLKERIGQGHAGTVYRALDEKGQRDVAVKLLHQHMLDDTSFMEHLRATIQEHEQLTHPNIASLLDMHEDGRTQALVSEFLQGCTLQQYLLYRDRPSWPEIHYIARGILDGLKALHAHGVEHGNIKPSNVFLCDDGHIRLTDFVLGKAHKASSPDALSATGSDREDIRIFGIMLYRMATGHWPFSGEHHADDIFNVSGGWIQSSLEEIPPPRSVIPDMPDCLDKAISALLYPDPEQCPDDIPTILQMLSALGDPVLPLSPEDDEGDSSFSNVAFLQKAELHKEISHDDEEAELDAAGIPMHSLLWVFKIASENAVGGVPLDLCSPPPIETHVLERLRQAIEKVPPLPDAWHQVKKIFDDPSSSPRDLARVVECDPVLVAQVLRMANSAAYLPSSGKAITNVSQAITRIGMEPTCNMLIQNVTPELGGKEASSKPDMLRIWFHSQAIAHFANILAHHTNSVDRRAASLYGLLHDIGKLIMLQIEDTHTLQKIEESIASGDSSLKAEWDVLGYTHIDAGMMLALHWQLPSAVHRIIYFHHHPCWHSQDTWPMDVREQIMTVHMAHLVLQSMMSEEERGGIWGAEQRTHVEGTEELLRKPIHLPLTNVRVYSEMQQELVKLKQMFPTLYPSVEEAQEPEEEVN